MVKRSTLAEANTRRPQEFFANVYAYLLEKYAKFLPDSNISKYHSSVLLYHFTSNRGDLSLDYIKSEEKQGLKNIA